MIEKISAILAKWILQNTTTSPSDSDEYELLEYGIECIINTLIPIIFFITYSLSQCMFVEMLCWFITFLYIRNVIGGYHASSHISCIIVSTIYGIISLSFLKYYMSVSNQT